MEKQNIFKIQEYLKELNYVSVPSIQREYGMNYREAKKFMGQLMIRNWIEKEPVGIRYAVNHENLRLRNIKKEEVDTLYNCLTSDCMTVLNCIKKKQSAEISDIIRAMRDEEDTDRIIELLIKLDLIYIANGMYFSCISGRAIKVLEMVVKAKRRNNYLNIDGKDETEKIKALFNELF